MKREEILALCASNPDAIVAYIESLESQIKDLSERLQALEARLNKNSRNSSKPPSSTFLSTRNLILRVAEKRVEKDMEVKEVTQERLLIRLMNLMR